MCVLTLTLDSVYHFVVAVLSSAEEDEDIYMVALSFDIYPTTRGEISVR